MADINIICERLTVGGLPTRFEDQTRLPMGVSVNSTSYSAKLLQVVPRPADSHGCMLLEVSGHGASLSSSTQRVVPGLVSLHSHTNLQARAHQSRAL